MTDLPLTEARKRFGTLVRRAATARERTTITDHGQPAAVLANVQELADLEEALALAEYRARRPVGSTVRCRTTRCVSGSACHRHSPRDQQPCATGVRLKASSS
jgi:prevent-host-death family protein